MRLTTASLVLATALLLAPAVASAQIEEGDKQLSLSSFFLQGLHGGGDKLSAVVLQGAYGINHDKHLEYGGAALLFTGGVGSLTDFGSLNLLPYAQWYFDNANPRLAPYVGGKVGLSFLFAGGETTTSFALSPFGGAKYFVSEKVALFGEVDYLLTFGDATLGVMQALVGISITFGEGAGAPAPGGTTPAAAPGDPTMTPMPDPTAPTPSPSGL